MKKLLERLKLDFTSSYFEKAYRLACADNEIPCWLEEEYIKRVSEKTGVGQKYLSDILLALNEIKQNDDLVLFAKTAYYMIQNDEHGEKIFEDFKFPESPDGNSLAYDLLPLFPIMAYVEDGFDSLISRGISYEMAVETYDDINYCIKESTELENGRTCFSLRYFVWSVLYAKGLIVRISKFYFEICPSSDYKVAGFLSESGEFAVLANGLKLNKEGAVFGSYSKCNDKTVIETKMTETDDYYEGYIINQDTALADMTLVKLPKDKWKPILMPGDSVISVHIPEGSLDREECEASYNMGRDILSKCYPEYDFSAFVCFSWLLSRDLKKLLKPESNILGFADKFTYFPIMSTGLDILYFIFRMDGETIADIDIDSLPETTSLTKNVKKYYKDGNVVNEVGGFFPF